MTAKEKAEELVNVYRVLLMDDGEDYGQEILVSMLSRQCALIAVDEILKENKRINLGGEFPTPLTNYWQEVKKEILAL
jgi:hypothetical protein